MQNVLAGIESKVSPAAIAAGAPAGLRTGHVNYGKELFDLYAGEDSKDTTVQAIIRMASVITAEEFRKEVAKAQEIADATDQATGWKAEPNAKGTDKYGPTRKVINTRMSEAKAIFGVAKLKPETLKEKGYWRALGAARDYLNANHVKWDGQHAPTKAEKQVIKASNEAKEAFSMAMAVLPKNAGESQQDYAIRLAMKAETIKFDQKVEDGLEGIEKLVEKYDDECMMDAVFRFVKRHGPDAMDAFAQNLHEHAEEVRNAQMLKAAKDAAEAAGTKESGTDES